MRNTTKKNRTVLLIVLGIIVVAAIVTAAIILSKIIKDRHNIAPFQSTQTPEASVSTENPSTAETASPNDTPSNGTPEPEALVELPKPDNPTEADDYFWETSKVYMVTSATESENVKTEKEAITIFAERGFTQYPIEYDYTIDGEYLDDTVAKENSLEKHPRYFTFFEADNSEQYKIYLIESSIIAFPISILYESDPSVEILISESDKVVSYNSVVNKFYLNAPFLTTAVVKTIAVIDAGTLNSMNKEDLAK